MTQEKVMNIMRLHSLIVLALDDDGTIGLFDGYFGRLYAIVQWDGTHIIDHGVKMTLPAWLGY